MQIGSYRQSEIADIYIEVVKLGDVGLVVTFFRRDYSDSIVTALINSFVRITAQSCFMVR